ncbi:MFS transporter [Paraburkholderia caribensis]|uniref:MFS transporter n=1 Tax=Paraburkholderia caribensis TaxID=75105 RepID=A0A9Q6S504_9BURK|nr:MFS transporter [Paraburkholderia caribensis]MCO4878578.1 MFS transporter [Paraburkholderia caribensis]PTB28785.1 MFS transporter [Paraburkholderia caribensis]QLB64613.1 MFS transporter [Paraburkholderia caribensis]
MNAAGIDAIRLNAAPVRWRAVAALTAVSTLSQIGQFGIGFMVLPVWLAHQGLDAPRAGLFAAAQWAGMFVGLLLAPRLIERIGSKLTVSLGLAASLIAYASFGALSWPAWILPGMLTGLGIGLRWIANETWLYSLVPADKSGKVVGVHETLIASAGVLAPALAVYAGVIGTLVFTSGSLLTLAAAVPLWLTRSSSPQPVREPHVAHGTRRELGPVVCLGLVTIAVGGIGDGALYGLFPLFADSRGLTAAQTATMLACFGIGGMALQFPVGWLADRAGLAATVILCALTSTAAIVAFAFAPAASLAYVGAALLLGGMNSAYITLGMYAAACGDKQVITRNMRVLSLAFTACSIAGPLFAGAAMKALGNDLLMWQLAIMSGALMIYTLGMREGNRQARQRAPSASS